MMPTVVFLLCAITSLACSVLLLRGYRASGSRLLLWGGIAFASLALNNALVFVDLVVLGDAVDLQVWRKLPALAGMVILLGGLIGESP